MNEKETSAPPLLATTTSVDELNELIRGMDGFDNHQIRRAASLQVAFVILSRGDIYREVDTVDLISCAMWLETGKDPYSERPAGNGDDEGTDAATWRGTWPPPQNDDVPRPGTGAGI